MRFRSGQTLGRPPGSRRRWLHRRRRHLALQRSALSSVRRCSIYEMSTRQSSKPYACCALNLTQPDPIRHLFARLGFTSLNSILERGAVGGAARPTFGEGQGVGRRGGGSGGVAGGTVGARERATHRVAAAADCSSGACRSRTRARTLGRLHGCARYPTPQHVC